MRVVSLTCSNTEIVCALGQSGLLVGVDDYSGALPSRSRVCPRIEKDLDIDMDKVVALKPDLILASLTVPGHERVVEAVAKTGIPYVAPRPQSLEDVGKDIRDIADLLGLSESGRTLSQRLFDETPPVTWRHRPKVIVEWWPKPCIVPAKRSWVSDLIRRAGGQNPFASIDAESSPISLEQAIDKAPDLVVVSWCGVRTQAQYSSSDSSKKLGKPTCNQE